MSRARLAAGCGLAVLAAPAPAPEALAVDRIDADVVTQHLQRDSASRDAVDRQIYDAHAPHTYDPLDPVITEHWLIHSEIAPSVPASEATRKLLLTGSPGSALDRRAS